MPSPFTVQWDIPIYPASLLSWDEYSPTHFFYNQQPLEIHHFSGEVISSHKGFWGTTYLVVKCTDGVIRSVALWRINNKIHS